MTAERFRTTTVARTTAGRPRTRGAAVALGTCSMSIGAGLGPRLAGALTGQGLAAILRVRAAGLVLGAAPAPQPPRHRNPG
ncbi:hypothetical protein [Streptomyces celluloflavus]|uniref:hypothetical protein n=1 Tax=Streptomyces celluloflavus TaxID=58344 RepID=UPI00365CD8BE